DGHGHFRDASGQGGTFSSQLNVARALIAGDIDNDGDLDLVVTCCAGSARMFRNDVPRTGAGLTVRAIDRPFNRSAIGARIYVQAGPRAQYREITPSSGYLSSHDLRAVFGLGAAESVDDITVVWSDGSREEFDGGAANRDVLLIRGRGRSAPAKEQP